MPSDPEIDWTRLSTNGRELEQLTRDLMNALGYSAKWSGEGADRGVDLIAEEPGAMDFGGFARKWLISCKHNIVRQKAVNFKDVDDAPARLAQHGYQGFLLVCTTHPSARYVSVSTSPTEP
jgi:Restriction endonuclease